MTMLIRTALAPMFVAALLFTGCVKHPQAVNTPAPPLPPPTTNEPVRTATAAPVARPTPTQQQAPAENRNITRQEQEALKRSLANLEDALFDYDKTTIRADAATALKADVDVIRTTLVKYPQENIRLEGHADQRGSAEYNLGLGDRRAVSVKEFLVTMGVPAGQLSTVSYGKEKPQCTDENEACWQKNRRVHLELASN